MQLSERDLGYLVDMLRCCEDILEFTATVNFEQFASDRMRRLATERQLETLGEAANHVSEETQRRFASIDWSRIIALRNKLAHDYGEILAERVWQIAQNQIGKLRDQLRSVGAIEEALKD